VSRSVPAARRGIATALAHAARRSLRSRARGAVLATCLVLLAALGLAAAASLWLTRSELAARGDARAARQARYGAEAGVLHALAVIAPGADFDALVAGAGGLADPSRPGPLPFAGGGWVEFPGPPFGYAVAVAAESPASDGSSRVRLDSLATAVRGARRKVRAIVGRATSAYAPAALVVTTGALSFAGHAVGSPSEPGTIVDARDGGSRRPAALAAASADGLARALGASRAASAALVGPLATAHARAFDVRAFCASSGLSPVPPDAVVAGVGAPGAPVAMRVAPGVAESLVGEASLLVEGDLTVRGETRFAGVLLVSGRLRLEGTPCRVRGMVWTGSLDLATRCEIVFDGGAIDRADAVLPLPRLPVLLSLADVDAD
jgi:hypothetical protein